jgi:SAM-dependent methyltransferase
MSFEVPGEHYDRLIGRYLPELGPVFADAAGVRPGLRALDIGCGPGGLTGELVTRLGAGNVAALDPSEAFVGACRERNPGVDVRLGVAEQLPFADGAFDVALASLVIPFMHESERGVREMARVAPTVAACMWDYTENGAEMLCVFRDAAETVDPGGLAAEHLPGSFPGELGELFERAGLREVEEGALEVGAGYEGFDDWWESFGYGVGPLAPYIAGLEGELLTALREECRRRLGDPQGPFRGEARAWFAVGCA